MKQFWEERYSKNDYAYGEEPNRWFAERLPPGGGRRILLPAEGEGRNAVHAARLGWDVHAVDFSAAGREKAMRLAARHGVNIRYDVLDLADFRPEPRGYDALGLVYNHYPPESKAEWIGRLTAALKPGGLAILEGFDRRQAEYQARDASAGGPRDPLMMYTIGELREMFADFRVEKLESLDIHLAEGDFHRGDSAIVRLFAVRI